MPNSRFDEDAVYLLEGHILNRFAGVAQRLDDPRSLSWDDRRDLANLINLSLMDVEPGDDDEG